MFSLLVRERIVVSLAKADKMGVAVRFVLAEAIRGLAAQREATIADVIREVRVLPVGLVLSLH